MNDFHARLYDRYRTYMGTVEDESWRRPLLRHRIKSHFPARKDVPILDIGCGAGMFLRVLRECGYTNLTGVDISPEQVQLAHRNGMECVQQANLFEFLERSPERSYDVVIAYDIVEHLSKAEALRMADAVFRVLRLNGSWMVHVPNAEGMFPALARWADLTHELAFNPDSVRQLARAAGFKNTHCHADKPVMHNLVGVARRVLYELARIPQLIAFHAEAGTLRRKWICSQNLFAVITKE